MNLTVKFKGVSRPREEVKRLELEFRDAMLSYCPSVERLSRWQSRMHWEYLQARQRGVWAVYRLITEKEREAIVPIVRFK